MLRGKQKKVISVLMVVCMLSTVFISNVSNTSAEMHEKSVNARVDDIYYTFNLEEKTAVVCEGAMEGDTMVIPSYVEYEGQKYKVTGFIPWTYVEDVEWSWSAEPDDYKHIVFPDTMESIYMKEKYLPNLESFNIPKNTKKLSLKIDYNKVKVTFDKDNKYYSLKNHALYYRKNPTKMYIPLDIPARYTVKKGTTEIESFDSNKNVTHITLPSSLKKISDSAFSACQNLKYIDLSKTKLKQIEEGMFEKTKNLRIVKLPLTLKKILGGAFYKSGIRKLKLPGGLRKISYGVFYASKLRRISIPSGVNHIGSDAFAKCKNLSKIKLSSNLKQILNITFMSSGIKSITIPKKVAYIDYYAFSGCKKMSGIVIENTKKIPKFRKNSLENTKRGIKFYVKNKSLAKSLKKKLKGSGVKKAKIYVGKKLIYRNVNGIKES